MARTQTMVQLTDDLLRALDEEARNRGVSRPALIRTFLEEHLHARSEAAAGREIADGSRTTPPLTPNEWGELEALPDRATSDVLVRPGAAERARRKEPW